MRLSARLRWVELALECKHCGHPKIKIGGWFIAIHAFKCEACKRDVPVTYSDKVALFEKNAHLAQGPTN